MDEQRPSPVQLTVPEAARRVGVSTKTIRRWLASGRLSGRFDGQAYSIDAAELERAATSGRALDVPPRRYGHGQDGQDLSLVQELLDRLERQAGELAKLRLERDQLAEQLRMLEAPKNGTVEIAPERAAEDGTTELTDTPAEHKRPWWRFW